MIIFRVISKSIFFALDQTLDKMRYNIGIIYACVGSTIGQQLVQQVNPVAQPAATDYCPCVDAKNCAVNSPCYNQFVVPKKLARQRRRWWQRRRSNRACAGCNTGSVAPSVTRTQVVQVTPVFEPAPGPLYEATATTVSKPVYSRVSQVNTQSVQAPVYSSYPQVIQGGPSNQGATYTSYQELNQGANHNIQSFRAPTYPTYQEVPKQVNAPVNQSPVVQNIQVPITPRITWKQKRQLKKAARDAVKQKCAGSNCGGCANCAASTNNANCATANCAGCVNCAGTVNGAYAPAPATVIRKVTRFESVPVEAPQVADDEDLVEEIVAPPSPASDTK